jgi:hypothetical protein
MKGAKLTSHLFHGARQGRLFRDWGSLKMLSSGEQCCQMVCFQTKYPNFGKIWEGLGMENIVVFYYHLEYFTAIWYNLWPFVIF